MPSPELDPVWEIAGVAKNARQTTMAETSVILFISGSLLLTMRMFPHGQLSIDYNRNVVAIA